MNVRVSKIQRLLQDIADPSEAAHENGRAKGRPKLERIAALGSTWVLTIQARR